MPLMRPEPRYFSIPSAVCGGVVQMVGFELQAVVAVVDPSALRFDVFTRQRGGKMADDGDRAAAAVRLDAQHREAVVGIVKGDALDDAG